MSIEVEILGQTYTVASDEGEEHVRAVATLVDRKMREVAAAGRIVSSLTVAVLTLLNIASEYQKLQGNLVTMEGEIDRVCNRLTEHIADVAARNTRKESFLETGR